MSAIVTHQHMRALGYCNRGLRRWFADRGVAWADFLENGIDSNFLRETGDSMAIAAADMAEQEQLLRAKIDNRKKGGCV